MRSLLPIIALSGLIVCACGEKSEQNDSDLTGAEDLQATCAALDVGENSFTSNPPRFSADGFVRDVITGPIGDGLSLYVPVAQFPDQPLVKCGLLDATRAPFNADATYPPGYSSFTPSLYRIERTSNIRLVNTMDRGIVQAATGVVGAPPDQWHMILERTGTGPDSDVLTQLLDRPVLYRRGYSTWVPDPYPGRVSFAAESR